MQKTDRQIKKY